MARDAKGIFKENESITNWVELNTKKHLCNCGCGNFINISRSHNYLGIPKYIKGHNGRHQRLAISKTLKEYFKTNNGKIDIKNHSKFMKEYFKNNNPIIPKLSKEQRIENSKIIKKRYENGDIVPWNRGRKGVYSKDTLEKMAKAKRGKCGEISPNWQGGKSFEKYPLGWNNNLKETIRSRDNNTCGLCGKRQEESNRKLDVHHIDYDKQNLELYNLVSLCANCHIKTNFNREYWIGVFKNKEALNV